MTLVRYSYSRQGGILYSRLGGYFTLACRRLACRRLGEGYFTLACRRQGGILYTSL